MLTLWEEYCDQMHEYISKNKEEVHVLLIVQYGSINDYKGNISVSNAFYITKLFINERNEKIVNFRRSYIAKNSAATSSTHRSIGQSRVMHVIVVGTVKAIDKDNKWYYLGCESCNRKASPSLIFPEDDGSDDVDLKEVLVLRIRIAKEMSFLRFTCFLYKDQTKMQFLNAIRGECRHFASALQGTGG